MLTETLPVRYSQTELVELMIPSYANFGGKIHGGILLSIMDKVAYACASKHAGAYCVTITVDNVEFLSPVEVGDLVRFAASVNYVGKTSLVVGIRVTAENIKTGEQRHTNTSYFTMVAKDDEGKPTLVPKLLLETEEEIRRFLEAMKRREYKKEYVSLFYSAKNELNIQEGIRSLSEERCVLGLKL
ncbi:thioesterase [bacterium 336/3]|nr:thioesterase [bacterium 336/3]